ncbi:enoyl-CoA hydratase/isomerase family protein [Ancylobacter pratisalsi]|uniref:Enoyl-CoA hydratase/isomerase family protein n=1 Tax=Ancylobacter pratisalsi TaxID=1745854 RepID=A0A6P1YMN9_9HYPH|nr:enoyl-CoA hydratase/isomerase family protein [Ancylobacter pratisalsi]QIB34220.1 enoyl-CoA hydratase/isomerase family protein [Ancylobacter pratisalsi]
MAEIAADAGRIGLDITGGIARIVIDRPQHLNALNNRLRAELADAVAHAGASPDTRVIVLRGAGERAFVAGADIEELIDLDEAGSIALSDSIADFHDLLAGLSVPVIAAIRGWCLGGGLELALAADIRLASEDARFGLPEIKLGILPGGGGIARLLRVAPGAGHLCLTGAIIQAERALHAGLVSEVCSEEAFDARVDTLATELAGFSPPALKAMKAALALPLTLPLPEATRQEGRIGAPLYGTPEQRAAMAAFLEARASRRAK